jgi:hypothetical protein
MALQVVFNNQILFDTGSDENVLVPFDEDERARAFYALTSALAVLSGVTPPYSSDAMATEMDAHCEGTGRYPPDHIGGVVVPLRARRADQDED